MRYSAGFSPGPPDFSSIHISPTTFRVFALRAGTAVGLLGVAVLAGWVFDIRVLKSVFPGLGLAICRRIMQEHGCTIQLESQAGKGTIVRLFCPENRGLF